METNIDDTTGEILGYLMDKLFEKNARDVFYTPIYMKKNRPAIKLEVICGEKERDIIKEIIFKETSTIGIREFRASRTIMEREIIKVKTSYGDIRVKKSSFKDITKYAPEYEDCKEVAERFGIPLREVYRETLKEIK
ncbi:MAG: nickel insertion protein [Tissierellaceae bacterium]